MGSWCGLIEQDQLLIKMSKSVLIILIIVGAGCIRKTQTIEFKAAGGENAVYNLFADSIYVLMIDNSISQTGTVRVSGDTLFLLEDVEYDVTMTHEVLFVLESDSICRLEVKENQIQIAEIDTSALAFSKTKYYKKDCELLKIIPNSR